MNRIRNIDNIYEVIVTPNLTFDPDMEIISGNWTDPYLKGFYIKKFNSHDEAYFFSSTMPDIDWVKLIRSNKDFYNIIQDKIIKILDSHNFTYDINTVLIDPVKLKHTVFERVKSKRNNFTLATELNDIVTVTITNPWYNNLEDMVSVLKRVYDLKIKKIIRKNKIIILIGKTYLGTSYTIKLIPNLIKHVNDWKDNNVHNKEDLYYYYEVMNNMMSIQNKIDKTENLR